MPDKPDAVSIELVTAESRAAAEIAEIRKGGGKINGEARPFSIPSELLDEYSDPQFEPLMVIAASVSLGFLIKRISDIWRDHARPGGQVIDTRGDTVVVRIAPQLSNGQLVLVSDEGAKVFMPTDSDAALGVLEKMITRHG